MNGTETAVAAVAACAAVLALALGSIAARTVRNRSNRRFEAMLERLDEHLGRISSSLERVVERAEHVRSRAVDDLELTVDFDELLRKVAAEAATRTGADAATVQVRGPGGEPRSAEFGMVTPGAQATQSLEAPLARATGPFRAVTINWSYRPGAADAPDPATSALVVPIVEDGEETGMLTAYAPAAGVFGPEHVHALEALAEETGPALGAARSFAEAQRELTDSLTGVRSSSGYDLELERAVSRARETGRPLSLLILSSDDQPEAGEALRDLASLLVRTTRATDVVCRRRTGQFGVVLPDTAGDPALRLYGRLLDAAARTSFPTSRQLTFASGLVEWRPNESSEALDARALAAVGKTRTEPLALVALPTEPEPVSFDPARLALQEQLAREIDRARHLGQPVAMLVVSVDGIRRIEEARGTTAGERVLDEVAARLREALASGDFALQVDTDVLSALLPGAGSERAERVFTDLRASLESDPATHLDRLGVSAGITELAGEDDAAGVVARAGHALERAMRAGPGTVVVAMPTDEAK